MTEKFETVVYVESLHGYRHHMVSVEMLKATREEFPEGTKVQVTITKIEDMEVEE